MPDLLSLSRAARLAGVSRADLQRRIRQGEISTFEGQVALADLLRVYPSISLEKTGMLEEVERIKQDAVPRLGEVDTRLPSPQVLVARIRALAAALAQRADLVSAQADLIARLRQRLDEPASATPAGLQALTAWLDVQRATLAERPADPAHTDLLARDNLLRIMSAHVRIIPSGHEFFVDGNDSILEAAVRSGLRLGYGCTSGNCGECKARVLSGEVRRIRDHDYVISQRERQMGYVLTCCNTAVTDLVLEAAEAQSPADLPEQELRAQVRKLERLDEDLLLLHVQTPRTQTLRFMAGQRARLTLESGASAELPIASCPCNGRNLQFLVRDRGDAFSQDCCTRLTARQGIALSGPFGTFTLCEEANEPAVFIAIGDGIAPIKSLIEHAVSIDSIEAYHLYWSVDDHRGHHQERWCRALGDALDNFHFTPLVAADSADLLARLQADLATPSAPHFYLAGPAATVQTLQQALIATAVPAARIALEAMD